MKISLYLKILAGTLLFAVVKAASLCPTLDTKTVCDRSLSSKLEVDPRNKNALVTFCEKEKVSNNSLKHFKGTFKEHSIECMYELPSSWKKMLSFSSSTIVLRKESTKRTALLCPAGTLQFFKELKQVIGRTAWKIKNSQLSAKNSADNRLEEKSNRAANIGYIKHVICWYDLGGRKILVRLKEEGKVKDSSSPTQPAAAGEEKPFTLDVP